MEFKAGRRRLAVRLRSFRSARYAHRGGRGQTTQFHYTFRHRTTYQSRVSSNSCVRHNLSADGPSTLFSAPSSRRPQNRTRRLVIAAGLAQSFISLQATLVPDAPKAQKAAVKCIVDKQEAFICSLREGDKESTNLDLVFDAYTEFVLVGSKQAKVHLVGYLMEEEEGPDSEDEDDEALGVPSILYLHFCHSSLDPHQLSAHLATANCVSNNTYPFHHVQSPLEEH